MQEEANYDREIVASRSYRCDVPYKNEIGDLEISDRIRYDCLERERDRSGLGCATCVNSRFQTWRTTFNLSTPLPRGVVLLPPHSPGVYDRTPAALR